MKNSKFIRVPPSAAVLSLQCLALARPGQGTLRSPAGDEHLTQI